jgi:tetratricopeptide (TPR) repeat protein
MRPNSLTFLLAAGATLLAGAACGDPHVSSAAGSASDEPLAEFRGELLDLAFVAASSMPVNPHHKSRARAQEAVVEACLELDQPQRALDCIEQIGNWRRGAGYAALAYWHAERGETGDAQRCLDLASRIADGGAGEPPGQAWRTDRIRAAIARTLVRLGRVPEADQLLAGMEDSESGRVQVAKASGIGPEALDEHLRMVESALATGSLDQARSAVETCARLFDRFYEDEARRNLLEERIKDSRKKLPYMIGIELMLDLFGSALKHDDRQKALALLDETQLIVEGGRWLPELRVPLLARLAAIRHRAGDQERARREADQALALFAEKRDEIVDIWRAGALRPLAEALHAMGDTGAALATYGKALEEGVKNPNSRPRAEDLTALCLSMAVHGIEPDALLFSRMRQICGQLSDPW